jgi:hypothetical protein
MKITLLLVIALSLVAVTLSFRVVPNSVPGLVARLPTTRLNRFQKKPTAAVAGAPYAASGYTAGSAPGHTSTSNLAAGSTPSVSSGGGGTSSERHYVSYVVYKSKAALSVKLVAPTWSAANTGASISREGGMFLEFAPSTGPRTYDWSQKTTFLMGPSECGMLLAKFNEGIEFVHDPHAQSPQAGQTMKKMRWAPAPDGKSLFATLSVNSKQGAPGSGTTYSVPVSWGEFVVIETVLRDSIPKFLGFDTVWKQKLDSSPHQPAGFMPQPATDFLEAPYPSAGSEDVVPSA